MEWETLPLAGTHVRVGGTSTWQDGHQGMGLEAQWSQDVVTLKSRVAQDDMRFTLAAEVAPHLALFQDQDPRPSLRTGLAVGFQETQRTSERRLRVEALSGVTVHGGLSPYVGGRVLLGTTHFTPDTSVARLDRPSVELFVQGDHTVGGPLQGETRLMVGVGISAF